MYVMNDNLKFHILRLNPGYRSGKSATDSLGCGEAPNGRWRLFCSRKMLKISTVLLEHVVKEAGCSFVIAQPRHWVLRARRSGA